MMGNLKKLTKEVCAGTAYFICLIIIIFLGYLVLTDGHISKLLFDFENIFIGSYAYKDYSVLICSLLALPVFVFNISIKSFYLLRLLIDLYRQEIVESIVVFYAKTKPISFDFGHKKGVVPQKYTRYRGRDDNGRKITFSVFPDVFNYKGNLVDKKYKVRYYKYSKVAVEVTRQS